MDTGASAGAPASVWDDEVEAELAAGIGRERLQRITECLAIPPLTTCLRVNTRNADPYKVFGELLMAAQAQGAAALPYRVPAIPEAILIPGSGPHAIDYSQCGTWIDQTGVAWCEHWASPFSGQEYTIDYGRWTKGLSVFCTKPSHHPEPHLHFLPFLFPIHMPVPYCR